MTDGNSSPDDVSDSWPTADHEAAGTPSRRTYALGPENGTWAGGDVPFGQSYDGPLYTYTIMAPPALTVEEDGTRVAVESQVEVHRHRPYDDIAMYLDDGVDFRFWPGNEPDKSFGGDYGSARFTCEWPAPGDSETCTLSFTPDDPSEIENFYWTIDDVSFGAWPGQNAQLSPDSEWVTVVRVHGLSGSLTSEPFEANGPLRTRYSFDFDAHDGYIYGSGSLKRVEGGECATVEYPVFRIPGPEREGAVDLGFRKGAYCLSFHAPDPNWEVGTAELVVEELR